MKTIFFLLLLSAALSAAPSANLPLDHWAYGFLERLEAKGLISGYELRVRPIPRSVAAELTARVLQNAESLQRLSRTDRRLLEQLRSDLQEEEALRSLGSAAREPHLHSSYEEDAVLHLDLIARQEILSRRGGEYVPEQLQSLTTAGARLRGTVGSSWALFAEARNTLSRGEERAENDENFDPAKGEPVAPSPMPFGKSRGCASRRARTKWTGGLSSAKALLCRSTRRRPICCASLTGCRI